MQPLFPYCRLVACSLVAALPLGCTAALPLARFEQVAIHARGDSSAVTVFADSVKTNLADLGGRLDLPFAAKELEVFLFDSRWEMRRYLRQHCPEQSGKAAACFTHPGGYAVTVVKSSQTGWTDRMVRHELAHFILASNYRDLPRWVDEGLAQYLEVDPTLPRDDKWKEFRKRRIASTEKALADLVSLPALQPLGREQYLLSWALVSFLMQEQRAGYQRIKSYLAQVEADGEARYYFESAFGSLRDLCPAWQSFLTGKELPRAF